MKKTLCLLLCSFAIFSTQELFSAWQVSKIGDYPIAGTIRHKGFILDDGCIYKPIDKTQKKIAETWQIGDTILLLSGKCKNRYILVNMRTGQKAVMKGVRW